MKRIQKIYAGAFSRLQDSGTEPLRQASGRGRGADEPLFQENPQVTCGITFNSKVYIIGEYLIGHNMKNFKLIGYDLLHRNVSCLKEGAVDFLIAQQPTAQGYSGVESLCNHLIFKKEVKQCNYMPITLLSVENVDFYLDAHKK